MRLVTEYRVSARALLTDPDGRVLLIRVHDDEPLDASDPVTDYWITVGGGVEAGESIGEAFVREVFEETGHRVASPGPCIWRRRKTLMDRRGSVFASDDHFFHCQLASPDVSGVHLSDLERAAIREFRWWELDDPELDRIRIFPDGFAAAARDVLRNGSPSTPIWLT